VKIALPNVIAEVVRDGQSSPAELAKLKPIALEYQQALVTGTQAEIAKSLLTRVMEIVGKERVKNAMKLLADKQAKKTAEQRQEQAAAAQPPGAAGLSALPPPTPDAAAQAAVAAHAVATLAAQQRLAAEAGGAVEAGAKRGRSEQPEARAAALAPPADGEAAAKRARKEVAFVDVASGLVADVNLDEEQARLLAPRPMGTSGTRAHPRAHVVLPSAPGGVESAEVRLARLARCVGETLIVEGLLARDASGVATVADAPVVELVDDGLRQYMRRLVCCVCDVSQRRRETAAALSGLERSDGVGGDSGALVAAGRPGAAAASVTLKERVQLKDALLFLETDRRTSKSPLLLWWRAVGTVRNRYPRQGRRTSAAEAHGWSGAAADAPTLSSAVPMESS